MIGGVATELHLTADLAAAVVHARHRAEAHGEIQRGPFPAFESTISPEDAEIIAQWLRDGSYDEAIARIAAEDPDLANQ